VAGEDDTTKPLHQIIPQQNYLARKEGLKIFKKLGLKNPVLTTSKGP
jgi:hypothetical protein